MYIQEKKVNQAKLWQVTTEYITKSPHKYIGALTFTENNKMKVGSATIISNNLILTAAHNIYDHKQSSENSNFKFYLAPHERTTTFYEIQAWRYLEQYKTCSLFDKGRYDYALMKLKTPVKQIDFLALQTICPECKAKELQLSLFGYPVNETNYKPVDPYGKSYYIFQFGLISRDSVIEINFSDGIMKHFINTLGGQSGSPIIANNRIIAIHNGATFMGNYNIGTLISKDVLNNLSYWTAMLKADGYKVFQHIHLKYEGKYIIIRNDIDKEECQLDYSAVKGKKVLEVLTNSMKFAKYYTCLVYKSTILRPEDSFSQINEEDLEENEKIELLFMKGSLRFYVFTILSKSLKDQDLGGLKYFKKYFKSKTREEDIRYVIKTIWQTSFFSEISRFIRERMGQIQKMQDEMQMVRSIVTIINVLKDIPIQPGVLYRGVTNQFFVHEDKNLMLSPFMAATPHAKIAKNYAALKAPKGKVWKMISFSGRSIARFTSFPKDQQFAFLPFNVFFQTRQQAANSEPFQTYQLVELSDPVKYCSKMLLWIGNPDQLSEEIRTQEETFGFEFLYIPSLFIFKKWQIVYGWLLRWKEAKVKIVINQRAMKKEKIEHLYQRNPLYKESDESRMHFLLPLYNEWGFKSDTLVYCDRLKDCKKRAFSLNVDQKCQFTDNINDIKKFIEFV